MGKFQMGVVRMNGIVGFRFSAQCLVNILMWKYLHLCNSVSADFCLQACIE